MYREIRDCGPTLDELDARLRAALLGKDTRTIGTASTEAQALILQVLNVLKPLSQREPGDDVNPALVSAAISSLNRAWQNAESVGLGTNADEMRDRAINVKTSADVARAYLRAAIGTEEI